MRLIDADELLKKEFLHYSYFNGEFYVRKSDIKNAPTVNAVERKKGKWIKRGRIFQCSECEQFSLIRRSFCPSCNTAMEGEQPDDPR